MTQITTMESIIFISIVATIAAFAYMLGRWDGRMQLHAMRNRVLSELKTRGAIKAIKLTKEITGWRLKESKEYVDRIRVVERLDANGK